MILFRVLTVLGVLILAWVAFAAPAEAYTCDATGCKFVCSYTEPSTLTNGLGLTDLASTACTYTVSVDGSAPGAAKSVVTPATKASGGGTITKTITEPTFGPGHTYNISATATATSTAFGTSAPSAPTTLLMNNGVSPTVPNAPTLN